MPEHKTEDYYLIGDNTQEEVCKIFRAAKILNAELDGKKNY